MHAVVLTLNTGLRFGGEVPKAEAAVPVEFVTQIPQISPFIAPMAGGNGNDLPAAHGPGPVEPEKFKKGSPTPAKKQKVHRPKKVPTQAEREQARRRAEEKRLAKELAAAERAARAEERRREAEILRQEQLAKKREADLRRQEELARRRAFLEEQRRVKAQRRAELEGQLAAMENPDDAISSADTASSAQAAKGRKGSGSGSDLPESEDAVYDAGGREGSDAENAKPAGGGFGDPNGGPVGWSISGPAGSRRVLKRVIPPCPDWVSQRGLDLKVQLRFRVLDDGSVKDGILVQRTSGFPDLDKLAIDALRKWRFDPYHPKPGEKVPEIWGVVKLHFVAG
ncbi:MAG: TonB family protein [Elusimicrobia bacterium]|nr:TonB family protein [Elusimicrobiota bacterium]